MQFAVTVGGCRIAGEDLGPRDGIPIVCHHGGPGLGGKNGDLLVWGERYSDTYRVICYDARGNGDSDEVPPYTHEQWANDLEAIRQELNLGQIVLTGGSYGGFIAMEYCLRYQQHVRALILRDTAASNDHHQVAIENALKSPYPMDRDLLHRVFAGQMRSNEEMKAALQMLAPLYPARNFDRQKSEERMAKTKFKYRTHNFAFSQNLPGYDIREQIRGIRVPTLVICGRHDWITPLECSVEIAGLIPGARLEVFEDSGHSPGSEEPEKFDRVVRSFLDEVLN